MAILDAKVIEQMIMRPGKNSGSRDFGMGYTEIKSKYGYLTDEEVDLAVRKIRKHDAVSRVIPKIRDNEKKFQKGLKGLQAKSIPEAVCSNIMVTETVKKSTSEMEQTYTGKGSKKKSSSKAVNNVTKSEAPKEESKKLLEATDIVLAKLTTEEERIHGLENAKKLLEQELSKLQSQKEKTEEQIKFSEEALENLTEAYKKLVERFEQMQEVLKKKTFEHSSLKAEVTSQKAEMELYQTQINQIDEELQQLYPKKIVLSEIPEDKDKIAVAMTSLQGGDFSLFEKLSASTVANIQQISWFEFHKFVSQFVWFTQNVESFTKKAELVCEPDFKEAFDKIIQDYKLLDTIKVTTLEDDKTTD